MTLDFRQVFLSMHAHLQMEEDKAAKSTAARAVFREEAAREYRLLLESLVQQALVNQFLAESAAISGTNGHTLKELLNEPRKSQDDLNT